MSQHVLLQNAHRYDVLQGSLVPEDCTYNHAGGYWMYNATGQPMMEGPNPKPPATKKADRETGEDQKGE